jgi:hypothetical protein
VEIVWPELEQISPGLNRYFPGWFE